MLTVSSSFNNSSSSLTAGDAMISEVSVTGGSASATLVNPTVKTAASSGGPILCNSEFIIQKSELA
jgi:hypothetical protein